MGKSQWGLALLALIFGVLICPTLTGAFWHFTNLSGGIGYFIATGVVGAGFSSAVLRAFVRRPYAFPLGYGIDVIAALYGAAVGAVGPALLYYAIALTIGE
jgi:hypothetical protein